MSINPQFENYRYVGEVCRLKGQSVVECRLPGSEIGSVLAVETKVVAGDCACVDGEVHYGGKVLLCIVYEDSERNVCRVERGAEFFHKAQGKEVSPACFAKAVLTADGAKWRREGSGLYLSVVVDADLTVYGGRQIEYLTGGDGLIVKQGVETICKTVCVSGETEGEDEFTADYVGDVLLHSENAVVHSAKASAGQIEIEGELIVGICVLKSADSLLSYERLIPFRMQIPCEDAFGHVQVGARVSVKSAHLTAGTDEDKNVSKMVLSYCLAADCKLHTKEELSLVQDAFCTTAEIAVKMQKDGGMYLTNVEKHVERISGKALLSTGGEGEFALQAALRPRAELTLKKTATGYEAEGAVLADVLMKGEGGYRCVELSLPFVFALPYLAENIEADCAVCGVNVRRNANGEVEAEATLKLCVRCYEQLQWAYVNEVSEGAAYEENTSAFSVFMLKADEELWEVAKRLRCSPEQLKKSNPNLTFPVKDGQKIYVYRQIV